MADVRLGRSEIAGRGWFAGADLRAGAVVLRLTPGMLGRGRVDGWGVDFPNHSCDPNVGWADEVTLTTMTDVGAGAELVVDYATTIPDPAWFLRCHCPSYRCRQMVEGTDWRIAQLQRRYAGWFGPDVAPLVSGAGADRD